jgi:hypothetical protein
MSTPTRRRTTDAAPAQWRDSSACQGVDIDTLYSERPADQDRVTRICRGCPVRSICLRDAIAYEGGEYMTWGVAGGLTDWQRRALRVEARLGNRPNLEQARKLTTDVFAGFMREWRDWPADVVAAELRKHRILASPVTVRVALWWTGGKGNMLPPKQEGDSRSPWMEVRDNCRPVAGQLRELGVGHKDIAAYLGVTRDAFERAARSWRDQDAKQVAA